VDLLGHVGKTRSYQKAPHRGRHRQDARRHAPAVLLAGMPAPLESADRAFLPMAQPIIGTDSCVTHISCGARAAHSFERLTESFGMISIRVQLELFLFVCIAIMAFAMQRALRLGMLKAKFGMMISRDSNPIVYWAYVGTMALLLVAGVYVLAAILIGKIPVA
jgi:hypothetical protein